jgi:hypothetical protein
MTITAVVKRMLPSRDMLSHKPQLFVKIKARHNYMND